MNKINKAYDKITGGHSKNNNEEVKKPKDRLKWTCDNSFLFLARLKTLLKSY